MNGNTQENGLIATKKGGKKDSFTAQTPLELIVEGISWVSFVSHQMNISHQMNR